MLTLYRRCNHAQQKIQEKGLRGRKGGKANSKHRELATMSQKNHTREVSPQKPLFEKHGRRRARASSAPCPIPCVLLSTVRPNCSSRLGSPTRASGQPQGMAVSSWESGRGGARGPPLPQQESGSGRLGQPLRMSGDQATTQAMSLEAELAMGLQQLAQAACRGRQAEAV